jgi:hypothetical protein
MNHYASLARFSKKLGWGRVVCFFAVERGPGFIISAPIVRQGCYFNDRRLLI